MEVLTTGLATCQPWPCSTQIFGLPACRRIGQNIGLPWGEKIGCLEIFKMKNRETYTRPPTVYQT